MVVQDDEPKQLEAAGMVLHLLLTHASQIKVGRVRQVCHGNSKHTVALPRPCIHELRTHTHTRKG